MDIPTPDPLPATVNTDIDHNNRKVTVAVSLAVAFFVMGFVAGRVSEPEQSKSVLGTHTSEPWIARLAMVFNLNTERPSTQTSNYQLAPTETPTIIEPTETPVPEPTDGEPGMIWAGTNRNPQPSKTPTPNNVIITPEQDDGGPTPTPKYKTNWDRNPPTPTQLVDKDFSEQADGRKTKPTPTLTPGPKPVEAKIEPIQVKQIMDMAGIKVEKPEITVNAQTPGYKINGKINDKLFGWLPVTFPVEVTMNEASGEIEEVTVPWWRTWFGNPFSGNINRIICGDGVCSPTENFDSCKADCAPVCGNGICEYGEGQDTCSADCELFPTDIPTTGQ